MTVSRIILMETVICYYGQEARAAQADQNAARSVRFFSHRFFFAKSVATSPQNRSMLDSVSGKTLPAAVTDAVRRQCDEFEAAWQAGKMPMLDDYLGDVEGPAREFLIRELTTVEQRYRTSTVESANMAEMTLDLPTVAPQQIAKTLSALPAEPSTNTGQSVGSQTIPTQAVDNEPTIAHSNETMAPTGRLVIRCPHCCNGVELLADTPFEDITCHDCGSTFNLVDRDKLTTAAAPRSVGRFRLEKKLGTGGFGTVWLALCGRLFDAPGVIG